MSRKRDKRNVPLSHPPVSLYMPFGLYLLIYSLEAFLDYPGPDLSYALHFIQLLDGSPKNPCSLSKSDTRFSIMFMGSLGILLSILYPLVDIGRSKVLILFPNPNILATKGSSRRSSEDWFLKVLVISL